VPLPSDEADARVVEDDGVWFAEYAANWRRYGNETDAHAATPPREVKPSGWSIIFVCTLKRVAFAASREAQRIRTSSCKAWPKGSWRFDRVHRESGQRDAGAGRVAAGAQGLRALSW
jgi:hypothetical protein